MKNKTNIKIVGPFDRFNYGDLLFPLIIKYGLDKLSPHRYDYSYYSIVGKDYGREGSIKSKSFSSLHKELSLTKPVTHNIIIAGGESIGATWQKLYSFINPYFSIIARNSYVNKIISKLDILKFLMKGYVKHPFCINKSKYSTKIKVAYNSVGGTENIQCCYDELTSAEYLAVRENITSSLLRKASIPHHVYPDCAILLSEIFPFSSFCKNPKIRNSYNKILEKEYIFFQIGKYKSNGQIEDVINQLNDIGDNYSGIIVLCPIGTAPGHEDHTPLYEISKRLKCENLFIHRPNIIEIMSLIAHSDLYIGTSLHGIITAMSYCKPYIGLNPKQKKLVGYLNTWGHKKMKDVNPVNNFKQKCFELIDGNHEDMSSKTKAQKLLYWESLKNMDNIFLNEN